MQDLWGVGCDHRAERQLGTCRSQNRSWSFLLSSGADNLCGISTRPEKGPRGPRTIPPISPGVAHAWARRLVAVITRPDGSPLICPSMEIEFCHQISL